MLGCDGGRIPNECNFDVNPTGLYMAVHTKQWALAADRAKVFPAEASVWVARMGDAVEEPSVQQPMSPRSPPTSPTAAMAVSRQRHPKVLRWRMLPLHGAVLFNAPVNVVETLIKAHPAGCSAEDDQGMLPLHLAFRVGASEDIVLALLDVYPEAIEITDYKGRVPSMLAPKDAMDYGDTIGEAYIKGPSFYYYAARVAAADRIRNETELGAKVRQLEEDRKNEYENNKKLLSKTQGEMQEEIEALMTENVELKERMAWYETKYDGAEEKEKVLVDHTNSLAERLRLTSLSEEHLATKLAKLEAKLKTKELELESLEGKSEQEKAELENQVKSLSEALRSTQQRADSLTDKLQKKIMEINETKLRFEKERKLFEKQIDASKECLMELISSSKEDKKMFDEDSKELRRHLMNIQSELQKTSQIPRSLEDKLDNLQREVINSRSLKSESHDTEIAARHEAMNMRQFRADPKLESKEAETMTRTPAKNQMESASYSYKNEMEDTSFDYYVSTASNRRNANHSYNAPVEDVRDDDGSVSLDESNLSDVDTAIALGDLSNAQREALESLDLGGSKEEIAATLSRVPGLTKNQVNLLVDVASSLAA